ncbi:hypothetical protein HMPREF3190_00746 [Umbribacter vaginalis]|nr:hypothetical protein HMPREF3190_00746 [Coriobacteriales bacterium DNF00809]
MRYHRSFITCVNTFVSYVHSYSYPFSCCFRIQYVLLFQDG